MKKVLVGLVVALVLVLVGCPSPAGEGTVATPAISPAAGTYNVGTSLPVTITCATAGATIYYNE